ncbi:MAG TPA: 2Fe-2S iron-sulfur cluster binding domain-containing protein [Burkholderiaceae bacterium]|jgi:3-phenylpropionate/trans-cinnamate dioxygenase ferredoxin reductase subunit|nr:2Fe-2S iron-sulfur cluster binding domain-containing protein [Burkholderiaceae bacterium]
MTQTHSVTLLFSDGISAHLAVPHGDRLVEAAAQAGLGLLMDCSNGQCGTCAARCVSGTVELGDYDASVLPDDEREDGAILCCVSTVTAPAVIELPYESSEASADEPPAQQGRVLAVTPVAEEVIRLDVEVPEAIRFLPGQYVRLKPAGQSEWRSYSMANRSGERHLVFYIRVVEKGAFSTWLTTDAGTGSALEVGPARGSFFLRNEPRPRLFVAGGTGVAPFMAMLEQIVQDSEQARSVPTRLLIGARTGGHFFGQQALDALRARIAGLEVVYAAEAQAPQGVHPGYATDLIAPGSITPDTRVYLCGPPPMVEAARAAAVKAGARKSDVLCERFA